MYQKATISQAAHALARGEWVYASNGCGMQLCLPYKITMREARKRVMRFLRVEGDLLLLR